MCFNAKLSAQLFYSVLCPEDNIQPLILSWCIHAKYYHCQSNAMDQEWFPSESTLDFFEISCSIVACDSWFISELMSEVKWIEANYWKCLELFYESKWLVYEKYRLKQNIFVTRKNRLGNSYNFINGWMNHKWRVINIIFYKIL